ncbi:glycosyltransferase family 4 protein [Pontimonas salivibrio]|uniref:glycosyltransferase family 4 protein n=1 Tax=Pontimonas salivibrio TaxID=1159327 RepID=UPI00131A11C2|nr:glycosyltransferase [Pontimonas salivibrio]
MFKACLIITVTDRNPAPQITLVGPTHPYTGGISQHNTRLALELEQRGISVSVESWKSQYPSWLYPGQARVAMDAPEVGIPAVVEQRLTWFSPLTWWRAGKRARSSAIVAFSVPTPFHAVPYLVMLRALGRGAHTVGIVHNVLPHEPRVFDRWLMRGLFAAFSRIIVHSDTQASLAAELSQSNTAVEVLRLPSPWKPSTSTPSRDARSGSTRLLFFGTVRHYKGLDLLLQAMATVPSVTLTVAGDFWEDKDTYRQLIDNLGLSERVTLMPGYLPEEKFEAIFGAADVLVLPYRTGTGSIVSELGFRFGLPVIATKVGAIADGIDHGTTGLVVEPDSVEQLSAALTRASSRTTVTGWQHNVFTRGDVNNELWQHYCDTLLNTQ